MPATLTTADAICRRCGAERVLLGGKLRCDGCGDQHERRIGTLPRFDRPAPPRQFCDRCRQDRELHFDRWVCPECGGCEATAPAAKPEAVVPALSPPEAAELVTEQAP